MRTSLCTPLASLAASALLLGAPQASQALLVYEVEGSSLTGTLGGVSFTDASWSLTATADETLATNHMVPLPMGMGTINLWSLSVSPKVRIQTMAMVLEADLLPQGNFGWRALSGTFPVGPTPKIGFVYTTPMFQPETAAGLINVPGSFVDLQSPISFSGLAIFEANRAPITSFPIAGGGELKITSSTPAPGTFRISQTPAPLPALAVVGAFSWSRRLRRRLARRAV